MTESHQREGATVLPCDIISPIGSKLVTYLLIYPRTGNGASILRSQSGVPVEVVSHVITCILYAFMKEWVLGI